jgi:23S rRNA pseudouridine2605 synthase
LILSKHEELTYKTHPNTYYKITEALVRGEADKDDIKAFERGMAIEDYVTAPAKDGISQILKSNRVFDITIHEGRNRQVGKCVRHWHEVKGGGRIKKRYRMGGLNPANGDTEGSEIRY